MNKTELVEVAAREAGITKVAAEKALSAIIEAVVSTVASGESVTLVGFGTFKSASRAERIGKNRAGWHRNACSWYADAARDCRSRRHRINAACDVHPCAGRPERAAFAWRVSRHADGADDISEGKRQLSGPPYL